MPAAKPTERFGWRFFAVTCPIVGAVMLALLARGGISLLITVVIVVFIVSLGLGFLFNLFGESASLLTHHRRLARGLCPHCGYDLRASHDICPECGYPVPVPTRAVEALRHVSNEPIIAAGEESCDDHADDNELNEDGIDENGSEPPARTAI